MKRMFELEARANETGYGITLRINGRPFTAAAVRKNGDTVDSAYKQLCSELHEVHGDIEDKWEYLDIIDARAYVLHLLCRLSGITKLEENT
ncbi:MAG: hypothetical protein UDP13_09975 [Butyricicoccus sp.]|nr:hypothetical protein [Butyricicoccus sp.]